MSRQYSTWKDDAYFSARPVQQGNSGKLYMIELLNIDNFLPSEGDEKLLQFSSNIFGEIKKTRQDQESFVINFGQNFDRYPQIFVSGGEIGHSSVSPPSSEIFLIFPNCKIPKYQVLFYLWQIKLVLKFSKAPKCYEEYCYYSTTRYATQKMKFSIKDFFKKCVKNSYVSLMKISSQISSIMNVSKGNS